MKKILALVLTALLVFSLAGCSSAEKKAYDLYTKASENLSAADSFAADMDMEMVVTAGEEKVDATMSGSIKEVIRSKTDIDMEMDTVITQGGMDIAMKMYYTNGYSYIEAMGQKMKMVMDIDEAVNQAAYNISFPEKSIKDATVEKVDGGQKVSFTLDSESMNEIFGDMLSNFGLEGESLDITYGDIKLVSLIDTDGNLKTTDMEFSFTMENAGETAECTAKVTMEITQMGGVTIEMPSDLDTYMEMPTA